jgi:hypothetical protein
MNIFEVKTVGSILVNGKAIRRTVSHEIAFPSQLDEIKFKHWHDYFLLKEEDPEWAKEMEKLKPEEQIELMARWGDAEWLDYYNLILSYLSKFTESDLSVLSNAPLLGDGGNGLVSIYLNIIGLINSYQPKEIETFEYKGDTYFVDKSEVDRFGRKSLGSQLTMNQVIDSLQYEHVFNVRDENGVFLIKDRKFQIDVALAALLSKKVLPDGSLEERPLNFLWRTNWTEKKIMHFMDCPMTVSLDIAFFLLSSNNNLKSTLMLRLYSRATR